MKKEINFFAVVWALLVVVFNAVTFIVPNEVMDVTRFDKPLFWVSYAFVMLSFAGQLVVVVRFCKKDTAEKRFLGLSLLRASYVAVSVCVIVGTVFMTLPVLPVWIGAIVCILVLAYQILTAVKITGATDYVEQLGEKVKTQQQFIRTLTADASILSERAKTQETKMLANKVYEAIRYSDPMSNDALAECETEIQSKYNQLKALITDDADECKEAVDELLLLIKERNAKCKILK